MPQTHRPCGEDADSEAWWATLTDRSVAQMDEARRDGVLSSGAQVFVVWHAAVVRSGEVGPRGGGAPALLVREILEIRPTAASDCVPADALPPGGSDPTSPE